MVSVLQMSGTENFPARPPDGFLILCFAVLLLRCPFAKGLYQHLAVPRILVSGHVVTASQTSLPAFSSQKVSSFFSVS